MKGGAYLRLTASVIFVALGLWLGAGMFLDAEEKQRTVTAEAVSRSDEKSLAGIIVREEKILCAEGDVFIIPDEGQWLSGGDAAAVSRDAAKAYFDYISATEKRCGTDSAYEAVCAVSVSKNREKQRLAAECAANLLFGGEEEENEHIPLPRALVRTDCAGRFSRFCDGLEGLGIHDDFSSAAEKIPETCIGKIVYGDCWYFVAEADAETADRLSVGMCGTLDGYPAEVEEISGGKIVFRVRRGVEAHLTDREKTLTLVFCSHEGISVPAEAVCGEDGDTYIRILRIGEAENLPVDIIYSDGDFCLVQGEGLVPGMQILLP